MSATVNMGSSNVAALEVAYEAVRKHHSDLPAPFIVVGRGRKRSNSQRLGHHQAHAWRKKHGRSAKTPEIFIAGECIAAGGLETFATLLHEAAHALAAVRGTMDVSRQGRYHTKRGFLRLAEELGLRFAAEKPHDTFGFSDTELRPETKARYAAVIERLGRSLVASIPDVSLPDDVDRNLDKAVCGCPRIIRASAGVLQQGGVHCRLCKGDFRAAPAGR